MGDLGGDFVSLNVKTAIAFVLEKSDCSLFSTFAKERRI
jgi:hypothetical protein